MDEEPERAKRWEGGYERTWEVLKEDESGSLKATVEEILYQSKRKRVIESHGQVRLGMMRHLFVVIDCSRSMEDQDLKPNRLTSTLKLPVCDIMHIQCKVICFVSPSGNPKKHIAALKKAVDTVCVGEPSLYNSLNLAIQTLKHMPGHTSREILIILSSLTTCDPANIYEMTKVNIMYMLLTFLICSTDNLSCSLNVRVSIIGLSAEVRVCTVLTRETGGSYHVILDESHFKELLTLHVKPPPTSSSSECSLIRMGQYRLENCDFTLVGLSLGGYFCPQCHSNYTELPVECKVCGLTLVSAPHLARSFHHLFPLEAFIESPVEELQGNGFCQACQGELKDKSIFTCPSCRSVFCVECDLFIHDSLHCCPCCIHSQTAS
uniref:General transcription factor IIH subunit n=1 Tax=Stegastes partitus TaxID=144197 RepID=A0A3B5BCP8_9TELE